MHQLQVNPDGSERLEYTLAGLPVRISTDRLQIFQDYAAACHWHDDFEILSASNGEMDYFVNSKKVHLKKGDGIFINARRRNSVNVDIAEQIADLFYLCAAGAQRKHQNRKCERRRGFEKFHKSVLSVMVFCVYVIIHHKTMSVSALPSIPKMPSNPPD